jgi:acyl-coenzyme A synthetase/AMP-(fatty) acid ligase
MIAIDFLLNVFATHPDRDAVVWNDQTFSYAWLFEHVGAWQTSLKNEGVQAGEVVALEADFSPNAIALFLALVAQGCIIVPLVSALHPRREEIFSTSQTERVIRISRSDAVEISPRGPSAAHGLYDRLRVTGSPGLVLFTSGSTGVSKAAVHDLTRILEKFHTPRTSFRTIAFLLYDHIGGVNTLLYTLSNSGCLVTVERRDPETVLEAIARHRVDLLPASPTFIGLILLTEAYRRYDLSSLNVVTYGTEPMPEATLLRFHQIFPAIELRQTYGLSEIGILRAKSKSSDSLWMKLGGEGFETRVVDGVLEIRARSAMLGYLNAPSPFSEDGWLTTGDAVDVDGDYVRVLGRVTDVINVGGEKVYPAEVEGVIEMLPNVAEAIVYGEQNAILGQVVCAMIRLKNAEPPERVTARVRQHCRDHLERFKVPVRVILADARKFSSERFKKMRRL